MRAKSRTRRIPAEIKTIATVLAVVMGMYSLVPSSYGYPIMSEPVSMEDARAADLATIQQMLETKIVQHRLEELGFTQDEIALRLEMASNADLHRLATQSEELMAGGAVGLVVTVLVVILLVIVIMRIVSNDTGYDSDMLIA